MDWVTIALSKGRIGNEAIKLLEDIGLCEDVDLNSRKLIFNDYKNNIRYICVKPSDVVTYVENCVADLGIVGKDTIMECEGDIYEILDLGLGKCKISVAGIEGNHTWEKYEVLKVATKYKSIASKYFNKKQQKIEVIKLNGSIELAPLVGLSNVIVDIVESGSTLRANGLEVIEDICNVSSKLICNRASYRFKSGKIENIVSLLKKSLEERDVKSITVQG